MELNCSLLISLEESQDWLVLQLELLRWPTFLVHFWLWRYRHHPANRARVFPWSHKNDIDCSKRRPRNITSLRHCGLSSLDGKLVQKLLQLPSFDQLIKEELQSPVILCSMTSVLMIMTVKILISLGGVSFHSIGPFKVGLILDIFQHLVDRLLKHQIYHLGPTGLRGA